MDTVLIDETWPWPAPEECIVSSEFVGGRIGQMHEWYYETATGNLVPGNEIRLFLDWTPAHSELPRYARITRIERSIKSGYQGIERGSVWQENTLVTYLDNELHPLWRWQINKGVVLGPTKELTELRPYQQAIMDEVKKEKL